MKHLILDFLTNKPLSYKASDATLLLFRLFAGLMMLPYGITKIEKYDDYVIDFFGDPIGIGMVPSLWLTIFAQIPCAIFLTLGLFSRPTALVLAINMLVAIKYHWNDPFVTVSLPLLFFGMYVILTLTGGGRYSIDSVLFRKKHQMRIDRDWYYKNSRLK